MANSYYTIAKVATQLLREQKEKPSRQAVLDALGSGSMQTVQKHMKEWESRNAELIQSYSTPGGLSESSDALLGLVAQIHERCMDDAGTAIEEAAEANISAIEAVRSECSSQILEMKSQLEAAHRKNLDLEHERALLTQRLADVSKTSMLLEEELARSSAANERQSIQIQGLMSELQKLMQATRDQRAALDQQSQENASLLATTIELREKTSQQELEIARLLARDKVPFRGYRARRPCSPPRNTGI